MPPSLDMILDHCFALLAAGAKSRKSPFHTPAVASIDSSGAPTQRIMVLRHVDRDLGRLRFHTDARSPKCAQWDERPSVSILGYDPDSAVQLRLQGTAQVECQSEASDAAWAQSTLFARRCYLAEAAPGAVSEEPTSGLPQWAQGAQPNDAQIMPARANFAIILAEITQIDWLSLANSGHRRAQFKRPENRQWQGHWVVP